MQKNYRHCSFFETFTFSLLICYPKMVRGKILFTIQGGNSKCRPGGCWKNTHAAVIKELCKELMVRADGCVGHFWDHFSAFIPFDFEKSKAAQFLPENQFLVQVPSGLDLVCTKGLKPAPKIVLATTNRRLPLSERTPSQLLKRCFHSPFLKLFF